MLFPAIASFVARNPRIIALVGVSVLLGVVYMKGREDCGAKHARAAAKIEAEWQKKVADATQDAFERGVAAAYADTKNEEVVDEIEKTASAEPGAGDICLSADVVELLRSLQ